MASFTYFWQKITVAMIAIGLAACGTVPQQNSSPQTTPSARSYTKTADISGRLSLFYEKNGQKQSAHGSFVWHQRTSKTEVTLSSPLGQTIAMVTLEPHQATLVQANREPVVAEDADLLTDQVLGWPLPIQGLKDWLQGFGINQQHQRFVATPEQTQTIITDTNWRLQYLRWTHNDKQQSYPERINLERPSEEAGLITIRIVIDSWQAQ